MCRACGYDILGDIFGSGRRGGFYDPFGFSGDVDRRGFASVSRKAMNALDDAKQTFLQHLATVDISKGSVTTEIIKFHLVPDMRKSFNKYVREHGCTATSRQLTRAEQDLINKTRKSLIWFTSVKVTPDAQQAYFAKHPELAAKHAQAHATGSGSNAVTAASAGSSSSNAGPLRDVNHVEHQKMRHKRNEAAVAHAASNSTVKKLNKA